MAIEIVEHDAFAGLPADRLVAHAHRAVFPLRRDRETEVGAEHALGDAAMFRDVIAWGQDREPGRLQPRYAPQQARRLGTARAIALARHAEAEQDEHLPMVAVGDVLLIG